MTKTKPDINSDPVYGLYDGSFLGRFTRLALLLDVFSPLASGPKSAADVAKSCQASEAEIRALLDYLNSTEVLEYSPDSDTFTLTPMAAAFLVRDEKTYAGDWVLANTDPALWDKVLQTIRSGKSAGFILPWAQDAWLESYSPSRIEYSLDMWRTVGVNISGNPSFTILDLACGCAIKTLAFAQANPIVQVTCVDSESVLIVARDLTERFGITNKTTFLAADILTADFGKDKYDAALLGLITYILTPEQNINIFGQAYKALRPGGCLVIDAIMSTNVPGEWASRATLLMRTWNGGAAHSFDEYHSWLTKVGFRKVVRHNEHLVSAIK
jgi:ubiquinone/menaquinone biosynthesis C-methylase UbiE